eukprot:Tamp_24074.p1 GENE.Tamp_24074~~Tamp_24074.p1  ORF type:complete len:312 (-),score=66.11 Tamp_24074:69-938(-)
MARQRRAAPPSLLMQEQRSGEDAGGSRRRKQSLGSMTLTRYPKLLPKAMDVSLSGAGLAASISALCILQGMIGVKLFAAPMMASGIIFFAAQKPPPTTGFLVGTFAGTTLCEAIFMVTPEQLHFGLAGGALLMVYRLTSSMFPPAAVLSVLIAQSMPEAKGWEGLVSSPVDIIKFAFFPWLSGHAFLYGSALAVSDIRSQARSWAMKSQLRGLSADFDAETLKTTFSNFDTSGDGFLDAEELRLALRAARGEDVPLDDCKELIGAIDSDGDGVVDFSEFCDICQGKYIV